MKCDFKTELNREKFQNKNQRILSYYELLSKSYRKTETYFFIQFHLKVKNLLFL